MVAVELLPESEWKRPSKVLPGAKGEAAAAGDGEATPPDSPADAAAAAAADAAAEQPVEMFSVSCGLMLGLDCGVLGLWVQGLGFGV